MHNWKVNKISPAMHWSLFRITVLVLLLLPSATSQSEFGGDITEDTLLDISGSPYDVTSTVVVHPNVILSIDPGVELNFRQNVTLSVGGSLIANGTEEDRIKFTSSNESRSFIIRPVGYYQIRLTGGSNPNEGRLEVFINGQWGTVCRDWWDTYDTQVACRQLGYQTGTHTHNYRFGSGPIWLDDVQCTGEEQVIWDCPHLGIGNHNCESKYNCL